MKNLIIIALILLPTLSWAQEDSSCASIADNKYWNDAGTGNGTFNIDFDGLVRWVKTTHSLQEMESCLSPDDSIGKEKCEVHEYDYRPRSTGTYKLSTIYNGTSPVVSVQTKDEIITTISIAIPSSYLVYWMANLKEDGYKQGHLHGNGKSKKSGWVHGRINVEVDKGADASTDVVYIWKSGFRL
jgi:hypothetical protein